MYIAVIGLAVLALYIAGVALVKHKEKAAAQVAARAEVTTADGWWALHLDAACSKCKSEPALLKPFAAPEYQPDLYMKVFLALFTPLAWCGDKLGSFTNWLIDLSGLDPKTPRPGFSESTTVDAFRTGLEQEISRFYQERGLYPLLVLGSDGSMPSRAQPTYEPDTVDFHEESVLSRALRGAGYNGSLLLQASGQFPAGVAMEIVPSGGHARLSKSKTGMRAVVVRDRSVDE